MCGPRVVVFNARAELPHIINLSYTSILCVYTLYLNDLLLRSKTYSAAKHDSNTVHKLRRAIVRLLYEGDSTYLRRGKSMEAALISSQSSFTFYNYIKFDV